MKFLIFFAFLACSKAFCLISRPLQENETETQRQKRINHAKRQEAGEPVIKDSNGFFFVNSPQGSLVLAILKQSGNWEPHVQRALRSAIQPGDHVLHLGAHVGIHDVLMSQLAGPTGSIDAFEPNPVTREVLEKNLALNDCQNVTVHPWAAFSQDSEVSFLVPETSSNTSCMENNFGASYILDNPDLKLPPNKPRGIAPRTKSIKVPARRLESLGLKTPKLLFMDIEGAEFEAVKGAGHLLDAVPTIIQEWSPVIMNKQVCQDYLTFWRGKGFSIAKITNRGFLPHSDVQLLRIPQCDIVISRELNLLQERWKSFA
jgi:FkbM family methyltransferase